VVLIDEFENGLYWEIQERLWPLIFEMAEMFDVQVFATSHSNDCLRSFTAAWQNSPHAGSMYRIERANSSARISRLPMANVSDALASQVEVR
jgi:AAA15 family ATPase/GTPase